MPIYARNVSEKVEPNAKCMGNTQGKKKLFDDVPHRIRNDSFQQEGASELNVCHGYVHG